MKFTFVTLFRELIDGYFQDSILSRAIENKLFSVEYRNPRDFTKNKHFKVDDYAVGGGAGLTLMPQPLFDLLDSLRRESPRVHIVAMTPSGKPFRQNDAARLAKKEHLAFVAGRYEGIDERVIETYCDEVFSIGDYILTGGELPSLVMCDAITRNIHGVLGNRESLDEESFNTPLLEAPSFSKPADFKNKAVPSEFLKGNHSKIADLKLKLSLEKTKFFRPDMYKRLSEKVKHEK
jgi:tRNA (guanine37-N1)-methyltransferase